MKHLSLESGGFNLQVQPTTSTFLTACIGNASIVEGFRVAVTIQAVIEL
jgi:hypothetical protein